jgi:hypothetical protein
LFQRYPIYRRPNDGQGRLSWRKKRSAIEAGSVGRMVRTRFRAKRLEKVQQARRTPASPP